MKSITLGNKVLKYKLIFKNRKTLEIRVIPPGEIVIISPKGLALNKIEEIIRGKEKWILEKLEKISNLDLSNKSFVNGELFLYLGKEYPLKVMLNSENSISFDNYNINIWVKLKDEDLIKSILLKWYYEQTYIIVTQLIKANIDEFTIKPNIIKVKNQKKIWGSCSSKRNLNFNFRLSMMPLDVIEYIVVHEMCHLVHMNHSKDFWTEVERVLPNYLQAKRWIKDNGLTIMNVFK